MSNTNPEGKTQVRVPVAISPARPSVRVRIGNATLLPRALSEEMLAVAGEVMVAAANASWPFGPKTPATASTRPKAITKNRLFMVLFLNFEYDTHKLLRARMGFVSIFSSF